jgi:hypothetical protein
MQGVHGKGRFLAHPLHGLAQVVQRARAGGGPMEKGGTPALIPAQDWA